MYKPEGGKPFDIHQDAAYMGWVQPVWNWTCWIALDDTYADGGTLVYVRGSHKWGPQPTPGTQIIAKDMDSWTDYVGQFAPEGEEVELVPLVFGAGSAAFHTGWIWHGSGPNTRPGNIRRKADRQIPPERAPPPPPEKEPVWPCSIERTGSSTTRAPRSWKNCGASVRSATTRCWAHT